MSEAMGSTELRIEGLSGPQETALAALRAGGTFVKAAEEAGVNRTTVYRWVHGDPNFRAAYNAWQQEAAESARARLVKLADMAVDVVEKALRRDDEKVALKVLRGVGAMRKKRKESTNAEVLELRMQLRDKRELRRAEMGMMQHYLKKMGMPARQRKHVLSGGRGAGEFREEVLKELECRGGAGPEAGKIESTEPVEEPMEGPTAEPMKEPTDFGELSRVAEPVGFGEGAQDEPIGVGPAAEERGEGDASSDEPQSEPVEEEIVPTGCDNPLSAREMHLASAGPEAPGGDASSDATSEGMLHESVA
jgi:hypothetical protein